MDRLEWPRRNQDLPGGQPLQQCHPAGGRVFRRRRLGQAPALQGPEVKQYAGNLRVQRLPNGRGLVWSQAR